MPKNKAALNAISEIIHSSDPSVINGGNYAFIRTLLADLERACRQELRPYTAAVENIQRLQQSVDIAWSLDPMFKPEDGLDFARRDLKALRVIFELQGRI